MLRRTPSARRKLTVAALALCLIAPLMVNAGTSPAGAAPIWNCDFNGDFLADVIIGSPNETVSIGGVLQRDAGRVDMLLGDANKNVGAEPSTFPLYGVSEGFKLGQTMLCGDLNADGFTDVILGVPFLDVLKSNGNVANNAGGVQLVYGGPAGFTIAPTITQASPGISSAPKNGDVFGSEIALGFFNDDPYPDLVVSAPGEDVNGVSNAGQVHIISGGPNGPIADDTVIHQNSSGIKDRNETNDFFGEALATGDFDGDGFDDLAVGTPREDVNGHVDAGIINVIFGDGDGLSRRDQTIHQDRGHVSGSAEDFDFFGAPLLTADIIPPFTGTRRFDLVVGVPAEDIGNDANAGAVYILAGTPSGLRGDRGGEVWHRDTKGIKDSATAGDEFGTSLAAGFFDGDQAVDLAIGVPGDDESGKGINHNSGSVHIIYGKGDLSGGLSKRDAKVHQETNGVGGKRQGSDRFGNSLAAGDFDGNLVDDLVVGTPQENVRGNRDAGVFHVFWGQVSGLTGSDARQFDQDDFGSFAFVDGNNQQVIISGSERNENFGVFNNQLGCCGGLSAAYLELAGTLPGVAYDPNGDGAVVGVVPR